MGKTTLLNLSKLFVRSTLMIMGMITTSFLQAKSPVEGVTKEGNVFALAAYHEIASQSGNLAISPFSISAAMAMTYSGARGTTAQEISSVFHFPTDPTVVGSAFQSLLASYQQNAAESEFQMQVANGVWIEDQLKVKSSFKQELKKYYGNVFFQADFVHNSAQTREEINHWIQDKTAGRIDNLLQSSDVTSSTKLMLVSALALKAPWAKPFPEEAVESPFYITAEQHELALMMRQTESFSFFQGDGFSMLQLPYVSVKQDVSVKQGPELAMILVLPEDVNGLTALEQRLNAFNWTNWMQGLHPMVVEISIPKFTISSRTNAKEMLYNMGLRAPFSMHADFSGIDGAMDLMIDSIAHEAYVAIDELGTEASAATAVSIGVKSAGPTAPKAVFNAHHPFLYAIVDRKTGEILFIGRVVHPLQPEPSL